MSNLNLQKLRE